MAAIDYVIDGLLLLALQIRYDAERCAIR